MTTRKRRNARNLWRADGTPKYVACFCFKRKLDAERIEASTNEAALIAALNWLTLHGFAVCKWHEGDAYYEEPGEFEQVERKDIFDAFYTTTAPSQ